MNPRNTSINNNYALRNIDEAAEGTERVMEKADKMPTRLISTICSPLLSELKLFQSALETGEQQAYSQHFTEPVKNKRSKDPLQ